MEKNKYIGICFRILTSPKRVTQKPK